MKLRLSHNRIPDSASVPKIAGILNLSPDSFSGDGSSDWSVRAERLMAAGADMLDVGAESTRPGSAGISAGEEESRLLPVLAALRETYGPDPVISVDTRKASVAKAALAAGADCINDVSGLGDPAMAETVAESGAGLILMHSRGTPETMQSAENLQYADVVDEVSRFFEERLAFAERSGIRRESVLLDPGIGFAKSTEQNLSLIRAARRFRSRFGLPLYYGVSRKAFIGTLTGIREPADRDAGTAGVLIYLAEQGVDLLRVHDVSGAKAALKMHAVLAGRIPPDV